MVEKTKKWIGLNGNGQHAHLPWVARGIDTAITLVLLCLSIYHFTQPNRAWRPGTTELVCTVVLLTAAYLVPHVIVIGLNLLMAVVVTFLGVRHLVSVTGWRSGTIELVFVLLLLTVAFIIYKDKSKFSLSS
jgi:hypothetical protein